MNFDEFFDELKQAQNKIPIYKLADDLEHDLQITCSALEFYTNRKIYHWSADHIQISVLDGGQKAREALKALRTENESHNRKTQTTTENP